MRNDWEDFWLALSLIPQQLAHEVESMWLINNRMRHPGNSRGSKTYVGPNYPFNTEKCALCGKEDETWDHLFLKCQFSINLFNSILDYFSDFKSSVKFPRTIRQALCPQINRTKKTRKIIISPFVIQVVYISTIFREARNRRFTKAREFTPTTKKQEQKLKGQATKVIKLAFDVFSKRRKEKITT